MLFSEIERSLSVLSLSASLRGEPVYCTAYLACVIGRDVISSEFFAGEFALQTSAGSFVRKKVRSRVCFRAQKRSDMRADAQLG